MLTHAAYYAAYDATQAAYYSYNAAASAAQAAASKKKLDLVSLAKKAMEY